MGKSDKGSKKKDSKKKPSKGKKSSKKKPSKDKKSSKKDKKDEEVKLPAVPGAEAAAAPAAAGAAVPAAAAAAAPAAAAAAGGAAAAVSPSKPAGAKPASPGRAAREGKKSDKKDGKEKKKEKQAARREARRKARAERRRARPRGKDIKTGVRMKFAATDLPALDGAKRQPTAICLAVTRDADAADGTPFTKLGRVRAPPNSRDPEFKGRVVMPIPAKPQRVMFVVFNRERRRPGRKQRKRARQRDDSDSDSDSTDGDSDTDEEEGGSRLPIKGSNIDDEDVLAVFEADDAVLRVRAAGQITLVAADGGAARLTVHAQLFGDATPPPEPPATPQPPAATAGGFHLHLQYANYMSPPSVDSASLVGLQVDVTAADGSVVSTRGDAQPMVNGRVETHLMFAAGSKSIVATAYSYSSGEGGAMVRGDRIADVAFALGAGLLFMTLPMNFPSMDELGRLEGTFNLMTTPASDYQYGAAAPLTEKEKAFEMELLVSMANTDAVFDANHEAIILSSSGRVLGETKFEKKERSSPFDTVSNGGFPDPLEYWMSGKIAVPKPSRALVYPPQPVTTPGSPLGPSFVDQLQIQVWKTDAAGKRVSMLTQLTVQPQIPGWQQNASSRQFDPAKPELVQYGRLYNYVMPAFYFRHAFSTSNVARPDIASVATNWKIIGDSGATSDAFVARMRVTNLTPGNTVSVVLNNQLFAPRTSVVWAGGVSQQTSNFAALPVGDDGCVTLEGPFIIHNRRDTPFLVNIKEVTADNRTLYSAASLNAVMLRRAPDAATPILMFQPMMRQALPRTGRLPTLAVQAVPVNIESQSGVLFSPYIGMPPDVVSSSFQISNVSANKPTWPDFPPRQAASLKFELAFTVTASFAAKAKLVVRAVDKKEFPYDPMAENWGLLPLMLPSGGVPAEPAPLGETEEQSPATPGADVTFANKVTVGPWPFQKTFEVLYVDMSGDEPKCVAIAIVTNTQLANMQTEAAGEGRAVIPFSFNSAFYGMAYGSINFNKTWLHVDYKAFD